MHQYTLLRSKRKTMSLEISKSGVVVRAPLKLPQSTIDAFVEQHAAWIEKHILATAKRHEAERLNKLTDEQITELKARAKEILPQRVTHYADIMGLMPSGVKITSAEKRFGSCSPKNSLCFSYRLMLFPEKAIDYVVVHELAHIKHKNHQKNFYARIAEVMPDFKARRALLKK